MKNAIALSAILLALSPAALEARRGEIIQGPASVIDGDTIEIRGQRVRLHGIDAPERKQMCLTAESVEFQCGVAVARALDEHIAGKAVACQVMDVDRWGRLVGRCDSPAPRSGAPSGSLNRALVQAGYAVAMPRYSREYVSDADIAKANRVGLWEGRFENPADWRRRNSGR